MASPNPSAHTAAPVAGASDSAITPGHCPGAAPDDDDNLTRALAKVTIAAAPVAATKTINHQPAGATAEEGTPPGVPAPPLDLVWFRPRRYITPSKVAARRAFRVPTDHLRAAQESCDRRRRRSLVRKCLRTLLAVHEGRARDRRLSSMMVRLTTSAAGDGDNATASTTTAAAAASSSEHAGLADLLDKMALSTKD